MGAAQSRTEGTDVGHWLELTDGVNQVNRSLLGGVEKRGLPASWFTLLTLLLRVDGQQMAMTPLAVRLDMTSGGLTKLIDRMSQAGLVERRTVPTDRRLVLIALTSSGQDVVQETLRHFARELHELVIATIGPAAIEEMAARMNTVARVLPPRADPLEPATAGASDG